MALPTPIDMTNQWSSAGAIQQPPNPGYITAGWSPGQNPPAQIFNWLDNRQDVNLNALMQCGILPWIVTFTYPQYGIVMGSDGNLYQSLVNGNIGNDPTVTPLFWTEMFSEPAQVSFLALSNGTQTYAAGASGIVSFNTVSFNNNGNYDNTTNIFTPTVPGIYLIGTRVITSVPISAQRAFNLDILKNNSILISHEIWGTDATMQFTYPSGFSLINMNGTTDNIRVSGLNSSAQTATVAGSVSFFHATKIN